MIWSPQQDDALMRVEHWFRDESAPQVFKVFGYAGTGKTSLARHFATGVDGEVLFGAYTGKAASVMRDMGCRDATTIHAMIYRPVEKSAEKRRAAEAELKKLIEEDPEDPAIDELKMEIENLEAEAGQPHFVLNDTGGMRNRSTGDRAKLAVIDECSMVDRRMGDDLLSFGAKVLVLGDPAQLPPVKSAGGYFTSGEPDVMLTEVHRHARDNPVLELATIVRSGGRLETGQYGESVVMTGDLDENLVLEHDQILVGRNATRRGANKRVREMRCFEGRLPGIDDKIVCLRNDHEVGLLNGTLWTVCEEFGKHHGKVALTIRPIDEEFGRVDVETWASIFETGNVDSRWFIRKEAHEFDYGYALTVHKAQGSQFDSVLVIDESRCFGKNARRHLYTALTRAVDRVTVKL